ncbi:MAG: CPBP family intramembrane metalloprotease [Ignavibacteria bacterium]|nr:CPBP family intramembrane metalloprotease [Ignavibacteria bacterium]
MQEFNPEEQNDNNRPAGGFLKGLSPFAYVIVVLAVIFFLYQFIGGALTLAAGGMDLDNPNVKITRIILAFGQFMFILAPAIFFARLQTSNLKEIFRLNSPKPVLVFLAVLGIIMIQPFLQGYMYFQEQLINSIPFVSEGLKPLRDIFNTFEQSTMKIVQAHSWFEFSVVVFVICITPAICEEALFRGFAMSNLRKVYKPFMAIFITGLLFAAYHFQPFNIIPLLILGFYLGFIVYYSNSLYIGILAHFLNNFFASYYMFVYGKPEFETPRLAGDELTDTIIALVLSILIFTSIIILFYRLRVKPVLQPELKEGGAPNE